jgi:hypothetical protein
MFESGLEKTIIGTAFALWFAHGWYLNDRLLRVHEKLDKLLDNFNGLQEYLYEIDPQFDDERQSREAFENGDSMFAGLDDMKLKKQKEKDGKRTLSTPFVR